VAATAARLASVLTPDWAEEIVAAAWLHDIGYAPALVDTRFHPVDGAAYLVTHWPQFDSLAGLVAHHTGAAFEAEERELEEHLSRYRTPVDVATLAILNCADLCTAPDGSPIDPAARIDDVLTRYPADDPVHRAVSKSAPLLISQARLVLGAAAAARRAPQITLPVRVEPYFDSDFDRDFQWRAVWVADHHHVAALGPALGPRGGVEIALTNPPGRWEPAQVASHDQAHPATALTPGAVIVVSGQASEREIVERLARRGGWTSRRLDRTDMFIADEQGRCGRTTRVRYSREGRIEVAKLTKASPTSALCAQPDAGAEFLREA